jgi:hypothetical protein
MLLFKGTELEIYQIGLMRREEQAPITLRNI